jgi:hypothetical protein
MLAAAAAFRREIAPWALLGLCLGLVEGATAAVLIKKTFATAADPWMMNLAVAFVSGAPALSNVVSFVWANLAHGRARIGLMVSLQAGDPAGPAARSGHGCSIRPTWSNTGRGRGGRWWPRWR